MRQEKKTLQEEGEEVKEGGWGQGHRFGKGPRVPLFTSVCQAQLFQQTRSVLIHCTHHSILSSSPQPLTFQHVSVCVCVLFVPGQRSCRTCDNNGDNDHNEDFFHKVAHAALPSSPNLHSDVSWLQSHTIHTHTRTYVACIISTSETSVCKCHYVGGEETGSRPGVSDVMTVKEGLKKVGLYKECVCQELLHKCMISIVTN